ncbi:MAG: hypothetical protein IJZ30_03885 [Alphaproteobacteria bacterium]|nr:hypothetical protein [Alphaproteobacteria bacterium]
MFIFEIGIYLIWLIYMLIAVMSESFMVYVYIYSFFVAIISTIVLAVYKKKFDKRKCVAQFYSVYNKYVMTIAIMLICFVFSGFNPVFGVLIFIPYLGIIRELENICGKKRFEAEMELLDKKVITCCNNINKGICCLPILFFLLWGLMVVNYSTCCVIGKEVSYSFYLFVFKLIYVGLPLAVAIFFPHINKIRQFLKIKKVEDE